MTCLNTTLLTSAGVCHLNATSILRCAIQAALTLQTLVQFFQTDHEMPLSYDLIMEAYRSLQLGRDYNSPVG